jgi:23S rRNA (guanosine2251-2'-O)-methyltransferase
MAKKFPIQVVLDNIRSAFNVGAIFRTCDAANIEKLYLCGITPYPPHNRIPKTALGAIKTVSWQYFKNTEDAIITIRQCNDVTITSVETDKRATNFWEYGFRPPLALVFGNEVKGVSKDILKLSDSIVKIPMYGKKESLNVTTSCGIVLYEVLRKWSI